MSWAGRVFRRRNRAPREMSQALREALLASLESDFEETEKLLEQAVAQDTQDFDAYLALARLYRRQGQVGRAIRMHQNLLLQTELVSEQRQRVVLELARDFERGGFLRRAIASYEELDALNPKQLAVLRGLRRLYAQVRNYAGALAVEKRLAKLEKRTDRKGESALFVEMAQVARAAGKSQDARSLLRKAIRRDASNLDAQLAMGELELERGRSKSALKRWARLVRTNQRAGESLYPRLAALFAQANDSTAFTALLREIVSQRPDDSAARLALAGQLIEQGEEVEAGSVLEDELGRATNPLQVHLLQGRLALRKDDPAQLKQSLEAMIDQIENSPLRSFASESLE